LSKRTRKKARKKTKKAKKKEKKPVKKAKKPVKKKAKEKKKPKKERKKEKPKREEGIIREVIGVPRPPSEEEARRRMEERMRKIEEIAHDLIARLRDAGASGIPEKELYIDEYGERELFEEALKQLISEHRVVEKFQVVKRGKRRRRVKVYVINPLPEEIDYVLDVPCFLCTEHYRCSPSGPIVPERCPRLNRWLTEETGVYAF